MDRIEDSFNGILLKWLRTIEQHSGGKLAASPSFIFFDDEVASLCVSTLYTPGRRVPLRC